MPIAKYVRQENRFVHCKNLASKLNVMLLDHNRTLLDC